MIIIIIIIIIITWYWQIKINMLAEKLFVQN